MPIFHRVISLFILIVPLVSCTTATSTSDSITPQSSRPVPDVDDLESISTTTARPSFTQSHNATPGQIQISITQATMATPSVVQTRVANFPRLCTHSFYSYKRFSPNGLWLEDLCYSEDDHDLVLTLSNSEKQVLWKLLYQDYIPQMDFVPDGGMAVVRWSNDGRYAYFFSFPGGDGGECFYDGGDRGFGLFRVDLQSGKTAAILRPNNNFWWYGFSLSPTDRRLVYGVRARDLKILDITTGQLISIISASKFEEAGGFLWSADGLKLVYSALGRDDTGGRGNYSLRLVDVQSGSEQILLESAKDCFEAKSWTENNILILEKNYNETLVEFDLNSNKIISESVTTP